MKSSNQENKGVLILQVCTTVKELFEEKAGSGCR